MNFLHNMSAPPRTSVTLRGDTVAGQTTVVCFVWALARKVQDAKHPKAVGSKRAPKNGKRESRWNWEKDGIPRIGTELPNSLSQLAQRLRGAFENPADLFADIGQPIPPGWSADFLIGYRLRYSDLKTEDSSSQIHLLNPVFCLDPLLCAGILARCAGSLFLSRRAPELSWHTLLDLPIAFDDPLASIQ
jgi:hypothetical protein